jgi:glycosyltransferase involved in cell wall biosynthesis
MRVLQISFDSGELCVRLASAVALEVDEVCLMLPQMLASPHLNRLDPRVNFQPFTKPRLREPLKQILLMAALLRQIRQYNPDVIHFQNGHLWFNLVLPVLRRYPLVITIHDPRHHMGDKNSEKTPQALMDFAFRRADQVIVHNEAMKQMVIEEINIPKNLINITPLIEFGERLAASNGHAAGDQVLYFGRIWKYKGLDYFIRAEPLVTAQVPSARFVIAGEGEDFTPYREMMLHPENFIVHNEFVSFEKREELFGQASIVVLPYVEATQSGVIPVAYTHARPVIATQVGGLPSQVEDGKTGYLVPPRDEHALAEKIISLLIDKALTRQMGENGRKKLENEWSADIVARQTVQVYKRTIQAFSQKRQPVEQRGAK